MSEFKPLLFTAPPLASIKGIKAPLRNKLYRAACEPYNDFPIIAPSAVELNLETTKI